MESRNYLIGEVSDLVGLSRDTLRYYEKRGILTTTKKENGYRYYTEDDLLKLLDILYNRKMNVSLETIENLWNGDVSCSSIREAMDRKIEEEMAQIRRHRQALERLKMTRNFCRSAEQNLNRISVRPFPAGHIIETCRSRQESMREWFYLSRNNTGLDMVYLFDEFSIRETPGNLKFSNSHLFLYQGLEKYLERPVETAGFTKAKQVPCIFTTVKSSRRIPTREMAEELISWGKKQNKKTSEKLFSNYILHGFDQGRELYYLELYLPVLP